MRKAGMLAESELRRDEIHLSDMGAIAAEPVPLASSISAAPSARACSACSASWLSKMIEAVLMKARGVVEVSPQ